jgi:hypothetical protein
VASPAPVINCDVSQAVQCDMEFLLQLYPCALAILAARSALCVENCELHDADRRQYLYFILHNYVYYIFTYGFFYDVSISHCIAGVATIWLFSRRQ